MDKRLSFRWKNSFKLIKTGFVISILTEGVTFFPASTVLREILFCFFRLFLLCMPFAPNPVRVWLDQLVLYRPLAPLGHGLPISAFICSIPENCRFIQRFQARRFSLYNGDIAIGKPFSDLPRCFWIGIQFKFLLFRKQIGWSQRMSVQ